MEQFKLIFQNRYLTTLIFNRVSLINKLYSSTVLTGREIIDDRSILEYIKYKFNKLAIQGLTSVSKMVTDEIPLHRYVQMAIRVNNYDMARYMLELMRDKKNIEGSCGFNMVGASGETFSSIKDIEMLDIIMELIVTVPSLYRLLEVRTITIPMLTLHINWKTVQVTKPLLSVLDRLSKLRNVDNKLLIHCKPTSLELLEILIGKEKIIQVSTIPSLFNQCCASGELDYVQYVFTNCISHLPNTLALYFFQTSPTLPALLYIINNHPSLYPGDKLYSNLFEFCDNQEVIDYMISESVLDRYYDIMNVRNGSFKWTVMVVKRPSISVLDLLTTSSKFNYTHFGLVNAVVTTNSIDVFDRFCSNDSKRKHGNSASLFPQFSPLVNCTINLLNYKFAKHLVETKQKELDYQIPPYFRSEVINNEKDMKVYLDILDLYFPFWKRYNGNHTIQVAINSQSPVEVFKLIDRYFPDLSIDNTNNNIESLFYLPKESIQFLVQRYGSRCHGLFDFADKFKGDYTKYAVIWTEFPHIRPSYPLELGSRLFSSLDSLRFLYSKAPVELIEKRQWVNLQSLFMPQIVSQSILQFIMETNDISSLPQESLIEIYRQCVRNCWFQVAIKLVPGITDFKTLSNLILKSYISNANALLTVRTYNSKYLVDLFKILEMINIFPPTSSNNNLYLKSLEVGNLKLIDYYYKEWKMIK